MTKTEMAGMIDQTLLKPDATESEVVQFCKDASECGFKSVCINPCFVPAAWNVLQHTSVLVCTVIDFPLGAGGVDIKISSALSAIRNGADELDLVIDLALVKAGKWNELEAQLCRYAAAVYAEKTKRNARPVTKLILETCYLSDEEIIQSSICAKKAGFDFVKTSTGFAILKDKNGVLLPNGATVHAVSLMRQTVGPSMGVKASGGIHNAAEALEMVEAGANRIGASSGLKIIQGL